jgi:hypothetical protein
MLHRCKRHSTCRADPAISLLRGLECATWLPSRVYYGTFQRRDQPTHRAPCHQIKIPKGHTARTKGGAIDEPFGCSLEKHVVCRKPVDSTEQSCCGREAIGRDHMDAGRVLTVIRGHGTGLRYGDACDARSPA